jgi:hypothetical protein
MIHIMKPFIRSAVLLGAAAGCSTSSPTSAFTPTSFSLRTTESVTVNNGATRITLLRVDNDSRCAIDVQCVTAGNAVVVFSIIDTACITCLPAQQFVNTTIEPRAVDAASYRVKLDSLVPAQRSGRVIAQSEYVAFFTVTK